MEQKRNEILEHIRKIAKEDPTWMKQAARRRRYYRLIMLKNFIHFKWLRFKRFLGLRK